MYKIKKRLSTLSLASLLVVFCTIAFAEPEQDSSLILKGEIEISIVNGIIDAEFSLNNIPRIKDYLIYLNSGLNVEYFRNQDDDFNYAFRKKYDSSRVYESFGYYFPDNTGEAKFLPPYVKFKYSGKFPVIADMKTASDTGDWKGNIAFNGKTLRTDGVQTAWYPVLYDIEKDKFHHKLKYDIKVTCNDCRSLYINGSKPVEGKSAHFKNEKVLEPTLFVGDYDFTNFADNYFLNSELNESQIKDLGRYTKDYQLYFENVLKIPYGDPVVFVNTTPVTKKNAWLFVSFPSVVNIGHDEHGLKGMLTGDSAEWFKPFLGHEIAHYYFGTVRRFNSELGDMFSESFAEYLSLRANKDLYGNKAFDNAIAKKLKRLKDKTFTPLKEIKSMQDYGSRNLFVYQYAPMLWFALEQEIGRDGVDQWLNLMLTTKAEKTDYEFMMSNLSKVVKNESKLTALEDKYFTREGSLKSALIRLALMEE